MLLLCALIVGSSSAWADYVLVTSTDQLVAGKNYLIVDRYKTKKMEDPAWYSFGSFNSNNSYNSTDITVSGDIGDTDLSVTDVKSAHVLTLGGSTGQWTLYDNSENKYVALTANSNRIDQAANATENTAKWTIAINSSNVVTISNVSFTSRSIRGNQGSSKFACYTGAQSANVEYLFVEESSATNAPSISAPDVNIAYDDEEGSITYTINNPVDGGTLTASTQDDWLVLDDATTTSVPFICDANSETTARTATVTLTYTYNTTETVTKDITITQAGAPVVYTTIPALFAAATSTKTEVKVTFNNWVVSGVSTNGKSVFVTDNNGNGFMIYSSSDQSNTYSVGDILSGTAVSCSLILYGGCAEITDLAASDLTITDGGTVSASNIAMADLAGVNTGALVSYDGLTCSVSNEKYYLTDGTTTIQLHNSLYDFEALESGHKYNITGIYQQYNDTKEILPRSADDIEELAVPVINADNVDIAYDATEGSITFTIDNPVDGGTLSASTEDDWITLGNETASPISFTCAANDGAARTATVTLTYTYNDPEETVTKDVTITQAKALAPAVDGVFDFTYEDGIDYGTGLEPTTDDIKEAVTFTAGNVTLTPEPTATNKYWRWYSAAGSTPPTLRLYTDTKMTIAVPDGYVITNIDFVGTQNLNAVSVSSGKYEYATDKKSATWTGAAQSVVFTRNGSNPFYTKVTVTYTTANQPITISAAGWASFSNASEVEIPEGVTAYYAQKKDDATVTLKEITGGYIPANTGVVVSGGANTYEATVTATGATLEEDNLLKPWLTAGVPEETTDYYTLAVNSENKPIFKKSLGGTLAAGKAYLVMPAGARELNVSFDEEGNTTAIDVISKTEDVRGEVYNLNGQRVAQPTKGLYIVNGKKVVVK